jgi:hypothetical protein
MSQSIRTGRTRARMVLAVTSVALTAMAVLAGCDKSPDAAAVGDCIAGGDADSMKVVDCSDPSAEWTVVQVVANPSDSGDPIDQCTDQSATEAWEEYDNSTLTNIVCLKSTT